MTKRTCDVNEVKERLKQLRKQKGLTQKAVADTIHFSVSTIKQYENGYRIPDRENLYTLASFYNVNPDWILGKTNYKTWIEEYDMEHKEKISQMTQELNFIEYAEKLGLYEPCDTDDFEKSYNDFLKYIKSYPDFLQEQNERGLSKMTREDVKVIMNETKNQIVENFEDGTLTIYATSEEKLEQAFQNLVKRGMILE